MLEDIRKRLRESVEFWSPQRKSERETYIVKTFLEHLEISHSDAELQHVKDDPPDFLFRGARFEVKEMMDEGRRRHDEYRAKLARAEAAKCLRELREGYTPKDLTYQQIGEHTKAIVASLASKYGPTTIRNLDLLVYENLSEIEHDVTSPIPDSAEFRESGWRSVSVVNGGAACVFFARSDSPTFLQEKVGRSASRPPLDIA